MCTCGDICYMEDRLTNYYINYYAGVAEIF